MKRIRSTLAFLSFACLCFACTSAAAPPIKLEPVTNAQFEAFVTATGYVTDAEKFGWSVVQHDLFGFSKVTGATWRKPDGLNSPRSKGLPVTQVSYNDAIAYCAWSGTELPTYDLYWQLIEHDNRQVNSNMYSPIMSVTEANVLGNVWEITATLVGEEVRLAGGSLFCSQKLCNGTSKDRVLFVDTYTANLHIGFAVINKSKDLK